MNKKSKILILGDGRIGCALRHFFRLSPWVAGADFARSDRDAKTCDLLIGALPGELGGKGLALALKYRKNLLDVSDIDPPFYLAKKAEIAKKGITVIPGCGFSPGVVNFILGHELIDASSIKNIEVKAGSLCKKKFFFPFLWCFEDLALEHSIPSWQVCSGKKLKFPPFAAYAPERFAGIAAESYFCASGFENVMQGAGIRNFTCRVVRPKGFMDFFLFLKNHGFLKRPAVQFTKKTLESSIPDNITLAEITIERKRGKTVWNLKAFSRKGEERNSMQKITASVPVVMARLIAEGALRQQGLFFMHELGRDPRVVHGLLAGLRAQGILCNRRHVT